MTRIRETRIVSGEVRSGRCWEGEPVDETRQHYANVGIVRYLRFHVPRRFVPFSEILEQFRRYGRLYDMGYRLRDSEGMAA